MKPISCPKWEKCSAPLCPLDPDLFKRWMLPNESVCHYLAEAVKDGAEAVFAMRGREHLFTVVSALIEPMSARWGIVRSRLAKARKQGSRMGRVAPWEKVHGR